MRVIRILQRESRTLFLLDVTKTEKAGFKVCFLCSDQNSSGAPFIVSASMAARTASGRACTAIPCSVHVMSSVAQCRPRFAFSSALFPLAMNRTGGAPGSARLPLSARFAKSERHSQPLSAFLVASAL